MKYLFSFLLFLAFIISSMYFYFHYEGRICTQNISRLNLSYYQLLEDKQYDILNDMLYLDITNIVTQDDLEQYDFICDEWNKGLNDKIIAHWEAKFHDANESVKQEFYQTHLIYTKKFTKGVQRLNEMCQ